MLNVCESWPSAIIPIEWNPVSDPIYRPKAQAQCNKAIDSVLNVVVSNSKDSDIICMHSYYSAAVFRERRTRPDRVVPAVVAESMARFS